MAGGSVQECALLGCRRYLAYRGFLVIDLLLSFPSKGNFKWHQGLFYAVWAE